MKLIKVVLTVVAVLLVQTMILSKNRWLHSMDLFLLINIYYALNFSQISALGLSVLSGFIQDTFSEGILGVNAFSKTVVVYLVGTLSARLMIKHPFIIFVLIVISTCIDFLVIGGLHRVFSLSQPSLTIPMLLVASFLNGITGSFGYQIADKIRVRKEYA